LNYQKRVINASVWVNESVEHEPRYVDDDGDDRFLIGFGVFNPVSTLLAMVGVSAWMQRRNGLQIDDEEAVL